MSLRLSLRKGLFPTHCQMCQTPIDETGLCHICHASLPLFTHSETNLFSRPDISRMFHLPHCDGLSACGWYQGALAGWLKQVKYNNSRVAMKILRQVIATHWHHLDFVNKVGIDACILVPVAKTRLIFRGYNQVYQTWAPLLERAHLPIINVLGKHAVPSQVTMRKQARKQSAKKAYYLKHSLMHKRILLIDDVMTTGATLNHISALCKEAGASQVWAFTTCLTET
ncbi:ComF family protein [Pseudoalteromonas luteoviolacea]|uniref:ComF family protein n=1 Tax=Pseudoalteromonas luteoviolacea TaxID=43657 RepID=UPI001B37484B|nr:ComF family protein [Pseudoalteromonas luteoviolacea]MBQ4813789.1 ComF family protein [Pseudoalteromonas luteoviolacea]